jgi:hypothetical protein
MDASKVQRFFEDLKALREAAGLSDPKSQPSKVYTPA